MRIWPLRNGANTKVCSEQMVTIFAGENHTERNGGVVLGIVFGSNDRNVDDYEGVIILKLDTGALFDIERGFHIGNIGVHFRCHL